MDAPQTHHPDDQTLPPGLAEHRDYEILRELGRGGMGVVYMAENKLMGRKEVLKVVSSHLVNRRGVLDRFLAEIRNAARLHHPNVVTAYSAIRIGESLVLAMEYVAGLDLAKMVEVRGPLPVANACNYVHQAALGLQHAHELGMVHRDIKPSNLMLARQGDRVVIKVLDFGLAKVHSEGPVDSGLTHEGQMLGTPDYIAPEQISNARRADIRADIYSLGCTLYYLLTGGPPFHGTSLYDILQAHHSTDAKPLYLARQEVPVELDALVAKMMAKEPERRFQEPQGVAQALAPFFKKGDAASKGSKPESSHAGRTEANTPAAGAGSVPTRPATELTPAPAPPGGTPAQTPRPEPAWESLVDLSETEPVERVATAAASNRRPPWLWPAVAASALLGGLVVSALVVWVMTPNGTIEPANLPSHADAVPDGNEVSRRVATTTPRSSRIPAADSRTDPTVVDDTKRREFDWKGPPDRIVNSDGEVSWERPPDAPGQPGGKAAAPSTALGRPDQRPAREPYLQPYAEPNPWPQSETPRGLALALNAGIRAVSRDGRLLAQKSPNIPLLILRSRDAANPVETGQNAGIWGAAFSPDGKYLASYGDDKFIRFWDTTTGTEVRQIPQEGRVVYVAFSPDGTRLAAVTHNNHRIRLWDAARGELLGTLVGHSDCPWFAAFSPDGTRLATCSGPWDEPVQKPGQVILWDLQTAARMDLPGHTMRASSVDFSPNGRYLVSTSFDRTAKVWDLKTLRCVTTFDKHQGYVLRARFSPDGRLVASIAYENPVRVWEAATGREAAVLTGHPWNPGLVAFSPGGRFILAGSGTTLKAWEAPADQGRGAGLAADLLPAGDSGRGAVWAYMTTDPGSRWNEPDFDDTAWPRAQMGFGAGKTAVVVRTAWTSRAIWLRAKVFVPALASQDGLRLHLSSDRKATVSVNGRLLYPFPESRYHDYQLGPSQKARFQAGENVIAVHTETDDPNRRGVDVGLSLSKANRDAETRDGRFLPLFTGKDLTGWKGLQGYWRVEGGALIGSPPTKDRKHTFLVSGRTYRDFELRFKVRLTESRPGIGNSGVQFRSQLRDEKVLSVRGPQCDIASPGPDRQPGSVLSEGGGVSYNVPRELISEAYRKDDFNEFSIKCLGKHVTIVVNGFTLVDRDFPQMPEEGVIAWELHGGLPPKEVVLKDVSIRELGSRR